MVVETKEALTRHLKDLGAELYAPDANLLEPMEEILMVMEGLST